MRHLRSNPETDLSKVRRAVRRFEQGLGEGLIRAMEDANAFSFSREAKRLFVREVLESLKEEIEFMLIEEA